MIDFIPAPASLPIGQRVYAVGDVHGWGSFQQHHGVSTVPYPCMDSAWLGRYSNEVKGRGASNLDATAGVVGQEVAVQTIFLGAALCLLRLSDFRRVSACA